MPGSYHIPDMTDDDPDLIDPTDYWTPNPGFLRDDSAVIHEDDMAPFGIPGLISTDTMQSRSNHPSNGGN